MLMGNYLYYDMVMLVIVLTIFIPLWVFMVLGWQMLNSHGTVSPATESDFLEFFWTVIPTVTVAVLCWYNLEFLCKDDFGMSGDIVKVIGRQWYWSYGLSGSSDTYDSLMGDFLNTVDKPIRARYGVPCTFLVTSSDVIHSFSLPVFGLKVDAIPGRVNQSVLFTDRLGVFVGYCTELCGAGHAYMPVVLEIVFDEKAFNI